jgi:Icc-related predicted phosphoesterase
MLDEARRARVRAILLGGDLARHGSIAEQEAFYRDFFLPLFRSYFEEDGAADVCWIMGNDDWAAHVPLLEESGLARLRHVHGRRVSFLDGWSLAGLAFVPASPFALKDWERWEEGLGPATRRDGFRSSAGGRSYPFSFVGKEREETMAGALDAIGRALQGADPARTICMFHGPPHGTALDQLHGRVHVGSRATRRFLEAFQPALALHGHIHESPDVSGAFADRIGGTLCVNPGQSPREPLRAVSFSLSDPAATIRHTRMGAPRGEPPREDASPR